MEDLIISSKKLEGFGGTKPLFELGYLAMSHRFAEFLTHWAKDEGVSTSALLVPFLRFHSSGDWGGGLTDEEKALNDKSIEQGGKIESKYLTPFGTIVVVTVADRSMTKVGFPEDFELKE